MKNDLYRDRYLSEGYPDLVKLGVDFYRNSQPDQHGARDLLPCLRKLIDLSRMPKTVAVIGCGPNPYTVRELLDEGFDACGIEPVQGFAEAARVFLQDADRIHVASAESMPFPDNSQSIVLLESVLEHVDSPVAALSECYRVVAPGGVLFVDTTNRLHFSLTGRNWEFRTPFYNWFPDIVKESYVFRHLHYAPHLADYSSRPAVHWFTFAELCKLGRQVGFAQFYSRLDFPGTYAHGNAVRRFLKVSLQKSMAKHPWLRSLALAQYGSSVFMYKRRA